MKGAKYLIVPRVLDELRGAYDEEAKLRFLERRHDFAVGPEFIAAKHREVRIHRVAELGRENGLLALGGPRAEPLRDFRVGQVVECLGVRIAVVGL